MMDSDIKSIHVLPIDDLREHLDEGTECWCVPRVDQVGDVLMVVHNSLDHREFFDKDRKRAVN